MDIGEKVWILVGEWNYFSKDTVGKQLVKAVDSIAANLSEYVGWDKRSRPNKIININYQISKMKRQYGRAPILLFKTFEYLIQYPCL